MTFSAQECTEYGVVGPQDSREPQEGNLADLVGPNRICISELSRAPQGLVTEVQNFRSHPKVFGSRCGAAFYLVPRRVNIRDEDSNCLGPTHKVTGELALIGGRLVIRAMCLTYSYARRQSCSFHNASCIGLSVPSAASHEQIPTRRQISGLAASSRIARRPAHAATL
jgi:hypothetical protein